MKTKIIFSLYLSLFIGLFYGQQNPRHNIQMNTGAAPNLPGGVSTSVFGRPQNSITVDNLGVMQLRYVKQSSSPTVNFIRKVLSNARCLSQDELTGISYEAEIQVSDPTSVASVLLPGAIINGDDFIAGKGIKLEQMRNRKATIMRCSVPANRTQIPVSSQDPNMFEAKLIEAKNQLISFDNFPTPPTMKEELRIYESTGSELLSVRVHGAGRYLIANAKAGFNFTKSEYKYKYVFSWLQTSFSLSTNSFESLEDLLIDPSQLNGNELYVSEVVYGRRLYVVVESEYDLTQIDADFKGGMDLAVLSAKLKASTQYESLKTRLSVEAYSNGIHLTDFDKNDIEGSVRKFMSQQFQNIGAPVPISFKLIDLQKNPIILEVVNSLSDRYCVTNSKVRIRIKSAELIKSDSDSRKFYGSINFILTLNGSRVGLNGQSRPNDAPANQIPFFSKENTITLQLNKPESWGINEQGFYRDIQLGSLDLNVKVEPEIYRQRNNDSDPLLLTANRMNRTVRRMLMDGTMEQTFILNFNNKDEIKLVIELVLIN